MPVVEEPIALSDGLDALDGVAYWTDLHGYLRGGGGRNWQAFSNGAGAPDMTLDSVIGRSIFEIIAGDAVREAYRSLHEEVVTGRRQRVTFAYRCDAPDTERRMRMSMGPLHGGKDLVGVLYHSQIVSQRHRPPMDLLSYREPAGAPIVSICSFCHRLGWPTGSGEWVSPEVYYQRGGSSQVRLSHGVCQSCFDRLATEDGAQGW